MQRLEDACFMGTPYQLTESVDRGHEQLRGQGVTLQQPYLMPYRWAWHTVHQDPGARRGQEDGEPDTQSQ